MTHTLGPWEYSFECIDPKWAVILANGGFVVANVNSGEGQNANAALVAAAPDMLAALQIAERFMAEESARQDIDNQLSTVRAAIAKATGGTAPAPAVTVAELLETLKLAEGLVRIGINADAYERALRPGCAKKHHDTIMAMITKAEGRA